jgi:hypothetical protein
MIRSRMMMSVVAGVLFATVGMAQTPASAPAGATGMCRDGSYWSGAVKKGACRGHKGVQDWYAASDSTTSGNATGTATAPSTPAASASAARTSRTAPETAAPRQVNSSTVSAAPGGGADKVWVNTTSKVYHCASDRWYGRTKNGAYMSEAQALAQGNRADHHKACK